MGNVHMEATQINYRGGSKKMSVEEAIKAAGTEITPEEKTWIDSIPALTSSNAGKTDQAVISPEFDAESGIYAVGDLVMHEGKLYEFTSAHETAGDWNSEEVSEKTVADEIGDVKSGLTNLTNRIYQTTYTIPQNGYVDVPVEGANLYVVWRDSANYTAAGIVASSWQKVVTVLPFAQAQSTVITVADNGEDNNTVRFSSSSASAVVTLYRLDHE